MDTLDELEVDEHPIQRGTSKVEGGGSEELQCPSNWPKDVYAMRAREEQENEPKTGAYEHRREGCLVEEKRFQVEEIPEELLEDLFEAPLLLPTQNATRKVQNAGKTVPTPTSSPLRRISNLPVQRKTGSKDSKDVQEGSTCRPIAAEETREPQSNDHASIRLSNESEVTESTATKYIPGPAGVLQRAKEMGLHDTIHEGTHPRDGNDEDQEHGAQDPVLNSPSWMGAIHSSGRLSGCIRDVLAEGKPTRISRMLVYIASISVSMEGGAFLHLKDATGSMGALLEKEALAAHEDCLTQGSVVLLEGAVAIRVSESDMVLCVLKDNVANIHASRPALPPGRSAIPPQASTVAGDGM